jgi:hypothetical protein
MSQVPVNLMHGNWAWSLPLIVATVLIHVFGLGLINQKITTVALRRRQHKAMFVVVIGGAALFATMLHTIEAAIWTFAYRILGALPGQGMAFLYSLGAMTTFGYKNVQLAPHWELMGALEALNGMMLFGVTTAWLFTVMQRVWRDSS